MSGSTSSPSAGVATRGNPDPVATVARWLTTLVDPSDGCVELRCLDVVPRPGTRPQAWCGFYSPDSPAVMAREALRITPKARGVYLTLNPLKPELLARRNGRCEFAGRDTTSSDGDVLRRRWLLVDVDTKTTVSGVSTTDGEKDAAGAVAENVANFLGENGWNDPIRCDSGNGFHLFYRIDLPNDDESRKLVNRVLKTLASKFDTDAAKVNQSVFNAGRIVKLPGTMARKGENTSERPHRRARLLEDRSPADPVVIDVELLRDIAEMALRPSQPVVASVSGRSRSRRGSDVICRARKYLSTLPPGIAGQNGSGTTFRAAAALVQDFTMSESDAWPLLLEFNERCEPPWSESELRHKLKGAIEQPVERGRLLNASHQENGHRHGNTLTRLRRSQPRPILSPGSACRTKANRRRRRQHRRSHSGRSGTLRNGLSRPTANRSCRSSRCRSSTSLTAFWIAQTTGRVV